MAKECPREAECFKRFDKVDKKLDDINDNLFVKDDCIKTQIVRLNVFKKIMCWFISACTVATFALIARLLYSHFTEK